MGQMSLLLRAWLLSAKVRRRFARSDPSRRRDLIAHLAPGKSFLDMGGMWGIGGDDAFAAESAGAKRVVICDGMDPTVDFQRKHAERSSKVAYIQGDLHDPGTIERLGKFDVVWCTGVLYHSPDPYRLIEHLRRLTLETLVLGSRVIPELPGIEGGSLFYPALSTESRQAFAWMHGREASMLPGAAIPFDPTPAMGYSNYWWGLTPSAIVGMLELAHFAVVERFQAEPLSPEIVARAVAGDSVLPALEFARQRGERRNQDPAVHPDAGS
jgi:SAM-dependent methyltransferase